MWRACSCQHVHHRAVLLLMMIMMQELCPGECHGGCKLATGGAHGQVRLSQFVSCVQAAAAHTLIGWAHPSSHPAGCWELRCTHRQQQQQQQLLTALLAAVCAAVLQVGPGQC